MEMTNLLHVYIGNYYHTTMKPEMICLLPVRNCYTAYQLENGVVAHKSELIYLVSWICHDEWHLYYQTGSVGLLSNLI